jgi:hypothetical protein
MRHARIRHTAVFAAFAVALSVILHATTASAQTGPEIGIGIGGISTIDIDVHGDGLHSPHVELRIATLMAPHWSVEGLATIGERHQWNSSITEGTYGVLFKRHLNASGGLDPFVTVGALGTYRDTVAPGWSDFRNWPPILPAVGAGVRRQINSRVAVQGSVEGMFLLFYPYGVRAGVGVAVGF